MSRLTFTIKARRSLDDLIARRPGFSYLKGRSVDESKAVRWSYPSPSYDIQIIAIGKTGYGKSTTLNALIGEELFETSDIESCTRRAQTVEYIMDGPGTNSFSLADLPGIGETRKRDDDYFDLYRKSIKQSHIILYFLRADQRDFSIDQKFLDQFSSDLSIRKKFVLILNAIDKTEPIQHHNGIPLSSDQSKNLDRKLKQVVDQFGFEDILPISAMFDFGLEELVAKIKLRTTGLLI